MLLEDILEASLQYFQGAAGCITGDYFSVQEIKTAQIIYAINVVGVRVGEKNGVNRSYALLQRLPAQVGGGVHQNGSLLVTDQNRGAGAPVPWVIRGTDTATTANHRNPGGCSTPQNGYLHNGQLSCDLSENNRIKSCRQGGLLMAQLIPIPVSVYNKSYLSCFCITSEPVHVILHALKIED